MSDERSFMLQAMNMKSMDELFSDVPASMRKKGLRVPPGISEYELMEEAKNIAAMNRYEGYRKFLGCGIYDRIIPSSVDSIISRSEFLTSYTPYQPEMSQGMLQSLFEYQSLMSDLMGMDVTNASMYDGYSALAEAVRMAYRINGKTEVLIPETLYRGKLRVIESYTRGLGLKLISYGYEKETGFADLDDLSKKVGENVSSVICENPNGFGILDENVPSLREVVGKSMIISYVDPVSLGVIRPPGDYDSDIAVAEGQSLGVHKNLGGPLLGIMSFKREHIRKSPGRIIGESVDSDGKKAYVMTLQTREQHIRREKAMSNICSNQALMAVAASTYLSILGKKGLRNVALKTASNMKKLIETFRHVEGYNPDLFSGKHFSDLPVKAPMDNEKLRKSLLEKNIQGAIPFDSILPNLSDLFRNTSFFSVTEKHNDDDFSALKSALEVV
ncbi:MAG: aminomethyl-transferring glycine dehydrogenase subunit GcvPA [Candidatus Thermoplasmatota archaeon]|jgi:glycine dehydrogenase subunit 1|nr:aminomethyl-transferring glycine dehydrogenase subunit GcvPA [Candidatus Thermoplasmatota archaeon]